MNRVFECRLFYSVPFSDSAESKSSIATNALAKEKVGCKGCKWRGKSLRGHLVRSESNCETLYDMEVLAEEAKHARRQKVAEWGIRNKEKVAERKAVWESTRRKKRKKMGSSGLKEESSSQDPLTMMDTKQEWKLECAQCGKAYSTQFALNRHIAAEHLGTRHECEECQASYARKERLDRHIAAEHLGMRHQCEECQASFARKESLEHHKVKDHSSAKEIRVACDECDKSFSTTSGLNRHKSEEHLRLMEYQCSDCPKKFSRKENLNRHITSGKHHFMYFCEQCKLTMMLRSRAARDKHLKQCSPVSVKILKME